jgi:hypothetical protein
MKRVRQVTALEEFLLDHLLQSGYVVDTPPKIGNWLQGWIGKVEMEGCMPDEIAQLVAHNCEDRLGGFPGNGGYLGIHAKLKVISVDGNLAVPSRS